MSNNTAKKQCCNHKRAKKGNDSMKKKLVTINTAGPINELAGGIWGPILTPTQISVNTISAMLSSGKKVFEVNPKNKNQTILLNKSNFNKDNFNTDDRSDVTPKLMEEAKRKEEARLAAVKAQEEADRIAKEEAEKAATIVQEEDPSVIPVHTDPVIEENTVEVQSEPVEIREPSNVEGFDIARENKKNKKRGDFRR